MAITKTNRLNMTGSGIPLIIRLSQYDEDFTLVFELYSSDGDFTVTSGTTAAIRGTKADGMGYSVNASLDVTNKRVTVAGDQQMTAMAGKNIFELTLTKSNKELNTANFILDVERAALDKDTLKSDSVIKELVDVIDRTDEIIAAANLADAAVDNAESLVEQTGNNALRAEEAANLAQLYARDMRVPLLACFRNVAWINEDGEQYYQALYNALYPPAELVSISAVFNQGTHDVHPGDSLDSLKEYLTVSANYSDGTSETITNYTLNGVLTVGVRSIKVSYNRKTTNFFVTVTPSSVTVTSIDAVFTQGSAVIYDDDTLDDLRQYLTVTATFSDSTTMAVTNYVLSGSLTAGTSTITATYGGQSDTFSVTVVEGEYINAVFNSGTAKIYTDDALDALKQYLTVTHYVKGSGTELSDSDYTLSGTLINGSSTITAIYESLTTTFTVVATNILIFEDVTELELGVPGWGRVGQPYDPPYYYILDPSTNRMGGDASGITFRVGDTISIEGGYSIYKYAIGTNRIYSSPNNRTWIGGGYLQTDYTLLQEDIGDAKVIMFARIDNADLTQADINFIKAKARLIKA